MNMGCKIFLTPCHLTLCPNLHFPRSGNIDKSETRSVKISKSIGQWFTSKKDGAEAIMTEEPESEPSKRDSSRASIFRPPRKGSISEAPRSGTSSDSSKRAPMRRATTDIFSAFHKEQQKEDSPPVPPPKSRSETTMAVRSAPSSRSRTPPRSQTIAAVEEINSPATSSNSSTNGEGKPPISIYCTSCGTYSITS